MIAIELPAHIRQQLGEEARRAFPRECCGLIQGRVGAQTVRAVALHPAANLAAEPERFEIDPAIHLALLRTLRGTERTIIGCYHSHPNGRAKPSPRDRDGAVEDGFLWLIVAINSNAAEHAQLAGFVSTGQSFSTVEIVSEPGPGLRTAAGGAPAHRGFA